MPKQTIRRALTWDGNSTKTTISLEDYISKMKAYGALKAKNVRTSRNYLRSIGLNINTKGEILAK